MTRRPLGSTSAISALLLLCFGIAAAANPAFQDCDVQHEFDWPWDWDPMDLVWSNNDAVSKPFFRLITEQDIRLVKPGVEYKISLDSLVPEVSATRFLITVASLDGNTAADGLIPTNIGKLRSLSDESEHINYRCPRYLVERSAVASLTSGGGVVEGFRKVPFSWEPPREGCVSISAKVLGSNGEFFTSENDPFAGLSLISCVDEKEVIRPPQEIDDAEEEEESQDEVNAHADMNSGAVALKLHQKDSEPRHWEAEEYEVDLDAAGPKEDLMLGDQGQGPTKHEKKMKRKAKKNCCKAGVSKSQESSYCDTAPEKELLEEALGLGLKVRKCEELVLKCCTGEKSLSDLSKQKKKQHKKLMKQKRQQERRERKRLRKQEKKKMKKKKKNKGKKNKGKKNQEPEQSSLRK